LLSYDDLITLPD